MLAVDEVRKVYVLFFVSGAPIRATDTGASTDVCEKHNLAEFAVKNVCGDTFSMLAVDEQRKLCVLFLVGWYSITAADIGASADVGDNPFEQLRAH
ncbi:hypothetical protein T4B_13869 [Trichinella pseudospiralis]|uniref:Uncharacterized protein n=1 Tax=Trichinella pseudospiralis TaxID=6337 RepID=A0A0V1JZP5_TRIPS|nr:hypothetical protein T4A_6979 [Trichinella pseudospiralis]KRZ34225.1 hypothetical protein T4B_13869 [Trichinella pseudospiralis]KRZ40442.1 hypothetical protein T4C_6783 [Trichinella pseudospiralis]